MKQFTPLKETSHSAWMAQRWGMFTSSETIRLMTDAELPELLTGTKLKLAVDAINSMDSATFSQTTGQPYIKDLRAALSWDTDITDKEAKYAFKMKDGPQLSEGGQSYAKEKAVERLTGFQETPELKVPHILWGKEQETIGISKLAFERNLEIINVGEEQVFIQADENSGGTPDGLIVFKKGNFVLEAKCPDSKTHAEYIINIKDGPTLKEHEPKYFWQMQDQMRCSKAIGGKFISFDPRFEEDEDLQLHVVDIERDDKAIALIEKQLAMAVKFRDEYIAQLKSK